MLTLTFLGVGSAFAKRNLNSNALIEAWTKGPDHQDSPDDVLLVDLGALGPTALHELKRFAHLSGDGINDRQSTKPQPEYIAPVLRPTIGCKWENLEDPLRKRCNCLNGTFLVFVKYRAVGLNQKVICLRGQSIKRVTGGQAYAGKEITSPLSVR